MEARGDTFSVDCPHCGSFTASGSTPAALPSLIGTDRRKATLIGHVLRRMQRTNSRPLLTSDVVKELLKTEALPTPAAQADNLVRWLGEHSEPGVIGIVSPESHGAIMGTSALPGLYLVLAGLKEAGLIVWNPTMGSEQPVQLTLKGWNRSKALQVDAAPSHRLAAVLSTDVVGYTKLMGADEKSTLAALATCTSMLREAVKRHGGRLIKTIGDGTLSEFGSAVGAMQAALEIHSAMVQQNIARPEDKRMILRMGLAVGDISPDGEDIMGETVNLAARLQAEAAPGTICVSQHVRDDLANKLELVCENLGVRILKNIERPVWVVQVTPK
jgi:class 3 adenylate cyclase